MVFVILSGWRKEKPAGILTGDMCSLIRKQKPERRGRQRAKAVRLMSRHNPRAQVLFEDAHSRRVVCVTLEIQNGFSGRALFRQLAIRRDLC